MTSVAVDMGMATSMTTDMTMTASTTTDTGIVVVGVVGFGVRFGIWLCLIRMMRMRLFSRRRSLVGRGCVRLGLGWLG